MLPYKSLMHKSRVQNMFGSKWKKILAVSRVLETKTYCKANAKTAQTYLRGRWVMKPSVTEAEVLARNCML